MVAVLRRLGRMFDDTRGPLALAIVISAAQSALLIPFALLVRRVFDRLTIHHDAHGVIPSSALMIGLYIVSALLGLTSRRIVVRITKDAVARLRHELLQKLYTLPLSWHDRHRTGIVHSTIVQDTERIDLMIIQLATQVLPALLVATVLLPIAFAISPELFAALLIVAPGMILTARRMAAPARARVREWLTANRIFSASAMLAIRALTLTRVEGAESTELERHRRHLTEVSQSGQRQAWAHSTHASAQSAWAALGGVVVLVVGATAVAHRTITVGQLLAFYAVLALLIRQLNAVAPNLSFAAIGAESLARVDELLNTPDTEPYKGTRTLNFSGSFAFDAVNFSYDPQAPLLHDVSFSISPGEQVTVLGPNGAGKSTLISLLVGLYRPQSGRVSADGIPLDELDINSFRRQIGVVLQESVMLPGSIRDNIAYGSPGASDELVADALELATARPFVDRLPQGLDTDIGDEGTRLSGGQRQRIAIARALVGDPALLVLDEPTTFLEDAAIQELMANLASIPGSPTVLIVTHDLEVARQADRLLLIRDGNVLETDSSFQPASGR